MNAGQDINALAATVTSSDGAVVMHADRDINLLAGQNTHSETTDTQTTKKGFLNKKETTTHDATYDTTAVGTTISGKDGIALDAGRNIVGVGTTLESSAGGIAVTAGDQVAFLAAQDTRTTEHSEKVRRSGIEWVPNPKQGTQKKTSTTQDVTVQGSTLDAKGPIVVVSGGDQTYQAANIKSDTGTALVSGGAINFETATQSESYTRDSSKHNVAYQAQDHRQRLDTTEVQTSISGPVTMAATDGINISVGQKKGETQNDAIARAAQQREGTQWIGEAKNNANVNFQSVDEQHVDEHQHHEGLTPAAAMVVTVAVTAATAGTASAAVGSTLGAGGGTFAAGTAATATTAATAAGVGNVIATGAITGAVSGAVNAGVQGYDIGPAAWKGFYTGAISAGVFYGAGELGVANNWADGTWQKTGLHMAAGGISNSAAGGSFLNGAISGGFAEWSSPYLNEMGGGQWTQTMGHAGAGAIASWITDGNVGQGALTGAAGYLFNQTVHDLLGLKTNQVVTEQAKQDVIDEYIDPAAATWNGFVDASTPNQGNPKQGWYLNSLLLGDVSISASGMAGYAGGVQGTLGLYNAASSIGVSPVSYGWRASADVNILTFGYNGKTSVPMEFKGSASIYDSLGLTISGTYSPPYNFSFSIDAGPGVGGGVHYGEINKPVSPPKVQVPRQRQDYYQ